MAAYNLRYIYLAVFVCLNIVKAYFPDLIPEIGAEILLPLSGWAGTYYVAQSAAGTEDGSSVDNPAAIATFNAGTAPFDILDDDTVYLLDTITTAVVVPDGGTAGHVATIRGDYAGHPCTITGDFTPLIKTAKSYVTIDSFSLAYTGTTGTAIGLNINGVRAGVTARNLTIDMNGYGQGIAIDGNNTNLELDTVSVVDSGTFTIYAYGAANAGFSLSNITASGARGIYLLNVAGLSLSNVSSTETNTSYNALNIGTASGVVSLLGITATTSGSVPVQFDTTAFGTGSTISTVTPSGSTSANGQMYFNTCTGTVAISGVGITSNVSGQKNLHFKSSAMTGATVSATLVTGTGNGMVFDSSSGITVNDTTITSAIAPVWVLGTSSNIAFNRVNATVTGTGVARWLIEDSAANISHTDCTMTGGGGFYIQETANNISYLRCTATDSNDMGFWAIGTANTITYTDCLATGGHSDGFGTMGADATHRVHDVTYLRCRATGNGNKATTTDGDGFTAHYDDYNLNYHYCIADRNTAAGYGFAGTTSGNLYNCLAYGNGGNWTSEGGADQDRAGFLFTVTDNNSQTSTSWKMRNSIGSGNYPRELRTVNMTYIDLDYNDYWPLDPSKLASIDGGVSDITWATYHGTYEAHSQSADPLFRSTTYLRLKAGSPAINAGTDVGLTTDFLGKPIRGVPDIGCYEFYGATGNFGFGFGMGF